MYEELFIKKDKKAEVVLSSEEILKKGQEQFGVDLGNAKQVFDMSISMQNEGKASELYELSNLFRDYQASDKTEDVDDAVAEHAIAA
ncbi:MAG: hypothetical protein NT165_00160 [Candidatus Falkowbacteria bacterium]|nr:hypothetical protein [Candidatus Falkowbacteria bacterium]